MLRFPLSPLPPFRLDLTAWALRRRSKNEIDAWDGRIYRRVLILGERPVLASVSQLRGGPSPLLEIQAEALRLESSDRFAIAAAMERLLGLKIDLAGFYSIAAAHPRLNDLVSRFRGLKPPRFASLFEAMVNGIACQQLSLEAGLSLLNRLSRHAGLGILEEGRIHHAFPRPGEISRMRLRTFRKLGFSTQKGIALRSLARSILAGELNPERLNGLSNDEAIARLQRIRGIGRWTAEYVLLRGLGRYDLFPGDDVGARAKLASWLRLKGPMDYERAHRALRYLGPYRGLVYFHLLLDGLEKSGELMRLSA